MPFGPGSVIRRGHLGVFSRRGATIGCPGLQGLRVCAASDLRVEDASEGRPAAGEEIPTGLRSRGRYERDQFGRPCPEDRMAWIAGRRRWGRRRTVARPLAW